MNIDVVRLIKVACVTAVIGAPIAIVSALAAAMNAVT